MTWVAWRQLRLGALIGALCLALLAAFLVVTGLEMASAFRSSGLAACVGGEQGCGLLGQQFRQRFAGSVRLVQLFQLLPGLLGVFLAAPLVAREYERGTHQLAFTQSVTRLRWLTVKVALLLALVSLGSVGIARLVTWWYEPIAHFESGRFTPALFSHEGIVPFGYAVFAVALGVAAGTILRRAVPAMALTLVVFFVVRLSIEEWLRPRYLSPLRLTHAADRPLGSARGDWTLSTGFVDAAGRGVSPDEIAAVCPPPAHVPLGGGRVTDTPACVVQHGFRMLETYQPASRFWLFQGIETGIFLGLAVVLLLAAVQLLRRRPG